jgi:hypothetical protein
MSGLMSPLLFYSCAIPGIFLGSWAYRKGRGKMTDSGRMGCAIAGWFIWMVSQVFALRFYSNYHYHVRLINQATATALVSVGPFFIYILMLDSYFQRAKEIEISIPKIPVRDPAQTRKPKRSLTTNFWIAYGLFWVSFFQPTVDMSSSGLLYGYETVGFCFLALGTAFNPTPFGVIALIFPAGSLLMAMAPIFLTEFDKNSRHLMACMYLSFGLGLAILPFLKFFKIHIGFITWAFSCFMMAFIFYRD